MDLSLVLLTVNGAFILTVITLAIIIARAASIFLRSPGDDELQTKLKWKILRSLVTMTVLGLLAASFNVVMALLT